MSLRAENIRFTWKFRGGQSVALVSLSAEFSEGNVHLICGPSGSGKSTLGYLLAGLMPPDAGRVLFQDADIQSRRTQAAYVFQFPENIFFEDSLQEELKQLSAASASPDLSYFDRLGVPFPEIANRHPFHLSAGYARLAATAMQLARDPLLLILDEPTIGLDWNFHRRMVDVLKSWISPQRLLMVITHDLEVMRALGGEAWALNRGSLAWNGATEDLLTHADLLETYGLRLRE